MTAPVAAIPASPLIGLEHCLRDIRADYDRVVAELDAQFDALGIATTAAVPPVPQKRRRWLR